MGSGDEEVDLEGVDGMLSGSTWVTVGQREKERLTRAVNKLIT